MLWHSSYATGIQSCRILPDAISAPNWAWKSEARHRKSVRGASHSLRHVFWWIRGRARDSVHHGKVTAVAVPNKF